MRAATVVLAVLLAPGLARAADPPPDPDPGYPWTHDVRPVVYCYDDDWGRLLNPLCRATGVRRVPRTTLEPLDPTRRLEFGERYDPARYLECKRHASPRDLDCEVYRLRRNELPVHFPYPGVPLPKLPDPPRDSGFRPGMSSQEYFEHLCRTEAGEFIYRTMQGVEGVFQMRPRVAASDFELRDRYIRVDPYGDSGEHRTSAPGAFIGSRRYKFLETTVYQSPRERSAKERFHSSMFEVPLSSAKYFRYTNSGISGDFRSISKSSTELLNSQYGYFWREIRRHMDRRLGIAGGEIVVLDLTSNEVLAIKRGFARGGDSQVVWWLGAPGCPERRGITSTLYAFISRVLIPSNN